MQTLPFPRRSTEAESAFSQDLQVSHMQGSIWEEVEESSGSHPVVPRLVISTAPVNLVAMQTLGPIPDLLDQKVWEENPAVCASVAFPQLTFHPTIVPGGSDVCKVREWLRIEESLSVIRIGPIWIET